MNNLSQCPWSFRSVLSAPSRGFCDSTDSEFSRSLPTRAESIDCARHMSANRRPFLDSTFRPAGALRFERDTGEVKPNTQVVEHR